MYHDLLTRCLVNNDQARVDELLQRHPDVAQALDDVLTTVDLSPVTAPAHWLTPLYLPVVVLSRHSLSPAPLPVDALTEHLAALTGRAGILVAPTLLTLPRLIDYSPCEHYGLAAQFAFNQLLGEAGPYPNELRHYVGHEGYLRQAEGLLLAGVMGPDRDTASVVLHPTAEGLLDLARLLSLHFSEEGQPSPRVYVGIPSLYSDFRRHALNLQAYTSIEQLVAHHPDETIDIRPLQDPSRANPITCQVSVGGQPTTRITVLREGWSDFTRSLSQCLHRYEEADIQLTAPV